MKTLEVQRAKHLGDSFTEIMREEFADHPVWLDQFKQIFFAKKDPKKLTDAECQARIRELLVLEHFPINIYATTARRRENLEWLYELYIENAEDQEQLLLTFSRKLALLHQLFLALKEKEWMIYQAVYWALVVLEQNGKNIDIFFDKQHIERLIKTILSKLDIFTGSDRSFGKNTVQRFQCLADFFNNELKSAGVEQVDFSLNLKSSLKNKRNEQKTSDVTDAIKQLDTMRLNRPDAVTKTIEDLTEDVKSHTFMIRPGYQRQEIINNKKASGIIESILLGIPLPTIFIYRRSGICEVVDGQQRLLSILAFLGRSYTNQENKSEYSKKNHYKLFKKITILKELGGRKFDDLDEKWQDCIWDFELSVVYIDEKLNDHFDPIDFFIRLNNKPYPVKDHSFEMWNSYCDRKIIKEVKEVARKHEEWFYYRKDNRRMNNEEMLTILAYLNFQSNKNIDKAFDAIEMYNWSPKPFTFRLSKILITEWLHTADRGNDNVVDRDEIINSIRRVEDLILKIKILLQSLHQPASADEEELSQNFNSLLEIKGRIRQQRPFYILWFLLSGLDQQIIELHSKEVVDEVSTFFAQHQVVHEPEKGNLSIKDLFRKNVEEFWAKFTS
ncbi:MAG: DUF262 domain-containing protein [Candidatus Electrothrix sp. ATG2]|nr:DUF262 domain-containing protein [Candidatus Electrothrix sp. ATG2]